MKRFAFLMLWVAVPQQTLPRAGSQVYGTEAGAHADRPHIILIPADDLAPGDLGAGDGNLTRTPNLDRLADQSVRFSQAYSASCVCAPAKAALLTGQYPQRTAVVTLNMNKFPTLTRLRRDESTIANFMQDAGYATGLIGKWHSGRGEGYHTLQRGFTELEGFGGSQALSYFEYSLDVNRTIRRGDSNYLTAHLSNRAIEFVRRHRIRPPPSNSSAAIASNHSFCISPTTRPIDHLRHQLRLSSVIANKDSSSPRRQSMR